MPRGIPKSKSVVESKGKPGPKKGWKRDAAAALAPRTVKLSSDILGTTVEISVIGSLAPTCRDFLMGPDAHIASECAKAIVRAARVVAAAYSEPRFIEATLTQVTAPTQTAAPQAQAQPIPGGESHAALEQMRYNLSNVPIAQLKLGVRATNILVRESISNVGQLCTCPIDEIKGWNRLGKTVFDEIAAVVAKKCGVQLGQFAYAREGVQAAPDAATVAAAQVAAASASLPANVSVVPPTVLGANGAGAVVQA